MLCPATPLVFWPRGPYGPSTLLYLSMESRGNIFFVRNRRISPDYKHITDSAPHACEKMEESKKRYFCEEESSSGSTSGSKNVAIESHASISVEAKRARSCSRYDTFTELERFAAEFGVQYSKICRPQNFGFIGEEGTDMSFLVLPLRMEPKLDIAVLTTESLNHLLETEQ